ncbi:MAG: hypothetical protein U5M50_10785 [Sphingobium sp.]|nr:hypothetical protein [Sphingobium sp.]
MSFTDKIFINLPVTDLARATAFYEGIGGVKNPMFSDEKASCIVLSDSIHVMLLTRDFFQTFAPGRTIVDPQAMVSAAYAFVVESRAACRRLVEAGTRAGRRGGHQPGTGPWLHVQPVDGGPGRPHLGTVLDGPGRRRQWPAGRRKRRLIPFPAPCDRSRCP